MRILYSHRIQSRDGMSVHLEELVAALRRRLPGLAYNLPAYRRLRRACHSFRPELIYERYNLYFLARAAERWVWRRADCVRAVTEVLRQRILAVRLHGDPAREGTMWAAIARLLGDAAPAGYGGAGRTGAARFHLAGQRGPNRHLGGASGGA